MPISRKNKHVPNKAKARKRRIQQDLKHLVAMITSQEILDHCLIDIDDVWKRREFFDALRPMLPFSAVFPSRLNLPVPRAPKAQELIVTP